VEGVVGVDEGILRRVGGLVGITDEAPGEAVAGGLVVLHEPRERRSVAADSQPDHRLLVGQWLDARRRGGAIGLGHRLPIITSPAAGVAESADASVSNTDEGNLVWVQLPPPAPASLSRGAGARERGG